MTKHIRCILGFHKYKEIAHKSKGSRTATCDECQLCGHRRFWVGINLGWDCLEELKKELGNDKARRDRH